LDIELIIAAVQLIPDPSSRHR